MTHGTAGRPGASAPPEHRGLARDEVRLVVARPGNVVTTEFRRLADHLAPGDLVVVNTSATVPAALDGWTRGAAIVVHVAGPACGGDRLGGPDDLGGRQDGDHGGCGELVVVELRRPDGSGPVLDAMPGDVVSFAGGAVASLRGPRARAADGVRLWVAAIRLPADVADLDALLHQHGRPITYGHLDAVPTRNDVQPDVARHPGSAEMASAGRPLTPAVVTDLVTAGIAVAPVTLHAGVSSQEVGETPQPERVEVTSATAALVEHTRAVGGRVVAIRTTVVRALESAVDTDGVVRGRRGWTDRVVTPAAPPVVVTGLVTGWHEAGSSHLQLLEAVAGASLVRAATARAGRDGLLWHEFGDSCLYLPARPHAAVAAEGEDGQTSVRATGPVGVEGR